MDEQFRKISVEIAGKSYVLKLEKTSKVEEEEFKMRKAGDKIRELMSRYRKIYGPNKDVIDLLAMVTFHLSMENLQLEEKNDTSPFTDKIQQLNNLLEGYLKEP